jgi:multiple sugar transport system substrate-binding protein
MQEIKLTIFNRGDGGVLVQSILDEFEQLHKIHVSFEILEWGTGFGKLVECALYGNGPDLSEVGSTWVMDFVRMNAVNNLTPDEVMRLGSENDFFPTNWNSGVAKNMTGGEPVVWAIPWTSDIRMAYYRRDLFEKANIDPSLAFQHIDSLKQAIEVLKIQDALPALALGTLLSYNNLHILASWIWDSGGDLIAPNGNQVAFDAPNALHGMGAYFQLGQHVPIERRRIFDLQADQVFLSGEAAIVFSGFWIVRDLERMGSPIVRDNLGLVAMPGASFVGGTHLLTWKHSPKREHAILLANFLTKHSAEHNLFPTHGLPAYVPSWQKSPLFDEQYATALFNALQKGRSFPVSPLWGLVEKRLSEAIPILWEKVWNIDQNDIEKTLAEIIVPLARRINITLE